MFDVTLSFDNGPTQGVTEDVLAVLADHDIRATFFVVGEKVATPAGQHLAARAHASRPLDRQPHLERIPSRSG